MSIKLSVMSQFVLFAIECTYEMVSKIAGHLLVEESFTSMIPAYQLGIGPVAFSVYLLPFIFSLL